MKFSFGTFIVAFAAQVVAKPLQHIRVIDDPLESRGLQDIVTWDSKSLYIHDEPIMILSGEFHPFRLPVPSLWLDVFQKVKALGMNTVSFYLDWALLEGKPGIVSTEGVFDLKPFFAAAKKAGIYLIARPGPYINAEVSGGGFPGWLQRVNATLRTRDSEYFDATKPYIAHVAEAIAEAQITNGGPVILYQPENEYSGAANGQTVPDGKYMQDVIDQARAGGVVVPMISNDQSPNGFDAPGSGIGSVDIYGHDAYFFGPDDCKTPNIWPSEKLPINFRQLHMEQSPTTPYSLVEFQAGCWLPWGGTNFDNCAALMGAEYQDVYYKNDLSFGVAILNLYMTVGGTNWGNIGFPQGYTSYDYAAAIREDRTVDREKYSELKLIANFLKTTPSYLDATPHNLTRGHYTESEKLVVTPLTGNSTDSTSFYVVRHDNETDTSSTNYKLTVPTSAGKVTIPQMGGSLTLHGRDSKIHVVDYKVPGANIIYSSAEVFTWKRFDDRTVLVVYGGADEEHEIEVQVENNKTPKITENSAHKARTSRTNSSVVVHWSVTPDRQIVEIGHLMVLMLDRADARNYWVPEISPEKDHAGFASKKQTENSIIVKSGYLVRTAYLSSDELHITADFNATSTIEVIGVPVSAKKLFINEQQLQYKTSSTGFWTVVIPYATPKLNLPTLSSSSWRYSNSLPEIQRDYDDSHWPKADLEATHNSWTNMTTPTSLFGADYGFHTGYLLFRGAFNAHGNETNFKIQTQGGSAFGSSVWLNDQHLGSWTGDPAAVEHFANLTLPKLKTGTKNIFTVIVDQNGFEEEGAVGGNTFKAPRGILNYTLEGHAAEDVAWKLTGNLGGEDYHDQVRGPLNEGGLYCERHGWHLPSPPSERWTKKSPLDGISAPGVGFFSTSFTLDMPSGYDVPLYITFANTTTPVESCRAQLYVNGYQFGKYISNIGPQTNFPVPEGILDYHGENWLGLTLWAQEKGGCKLDGIDITAGTPVKTAYQKVDLVSMPAYRQRDGVY